MAVAQVRRISHEVSSHRTTFFDYRATFNRYCTSFTCYCTTLGIYCTSSHYMNEGFLRWQKTNLLDGGRHREWLSHELGEYRTMFPLIARVSSIIARLSIIIARVSHAIARLLEFIARVHTIGMKVFCHRRKP